MRVDAIVVPALQLARGYATAAFRSVLDHRPRRAILYVPGDSERKLKKASGGTGADTVCLDLEDAVAPSRKEAARNTLATALSTLTFGGSERAVRINSMESGHAEEDLRCLFGDARELPEAVVVPKVENVDHVSFVFDRVRSFGGPTRPADRAPPVLITMCESGMALLNLKSVFEACLQSSDPPLCLEACIFGGDDFCASQGLKRRPGSGDTLFARRWVALHARTFGVQRIDQVYTDYQDTAGLLAEAEEGRRLGFCGKQVIHPAQVPVVQAAFSPDGAEVDEARQLVATFEEHAQRGVGAFVFKGKMIDQPTYLQAKALLRFAERAGL